MPSRSLKLKVASRPASESAPYPTERSVILREPARAGEVLLRAHPYAAVLRDELRHTHCSETFEELGANALRGSGVCYANDAARKAAERRGFDRAAQLEERKGAPSASARLALACLARRDCERNGTLAREVYELCDCDDARGYEALMSLHEGPATKSKSSSNASLQRTQETAAMAQIIVALMADAMRPGITPDEIEAQMRALKTTKGVETKMVLELLSRLAVNAFSIATDDGQRLGLGIYPSASMFNHSSTPNADVTFVGKTLVVKALRNIDAWEQVTITYGEQYVPRECTRRRMLATYEFDEYDKFPNTARADAARERAMKMATRSTLGHNLGTLVDLGEDCALYADEQYLAAPDLKRDAAWFQLKGDAPTAGIMYIQGDPKSEGYHPNDDEIIIWGKFPKGADREATALNFSKCYRMIELVSKSVEKDVHKDRADMMKMLSVANTMLLGDGGKIAGVIGTHEVIKGMQLTGVVICGSHPRPCPEELEVGVSLAMRSCSYSLQHIYEMSAGFSPVDAVYMHLMYQIFKLTLNLLHYSIVREDYGDVVKKIKEAIMMYNELKMLMKIAGVPGGVLYEEWKAHSKGYEEDLANLRVIGKEIIAIGMQKKPSQHTRTSS